MKWLSMPNAQRDNLFVKGIKGNVAAKVEGLNASDYIKWGYKSTKQIKHKTH